MRLVTREYFVQLGPRPRRSLDLFIACTLKPNEALGVTEFLDSFEQMKAPDHAGFVHTLTETPDVRGRVHLAKQSPICEKVSILHQAQILILHRLVLDNSIYQPDYEQIRQVRKSV